MATTVAPASRTRAELAEALTNLGAHAKRQPRVMRLFENDPPTRWDAAHESVNEHLTLWELS